LFDVFVFRFSGMFYEKDAWNVSAAWYDADVAEYERSGDGTPWSATPHFEKCANGSESGGENTPCATVKDVVEASIASLGALLDQYRVDVYAAGHVHSYSTKWPIFGGAVAKKSLVNPQGTVHVVEGNGGAPGAHTHSKITPCKKSSPHAPHHPTCFGSAAKERTMDGL
jgi:hypothetical protein